MKLSCKNVFLLASLSSLHGTHCVPYNLKLFYMEKYEKKNEKKQITYQFKLDINTCIDSVYTSFINSKNRFTIIIKKKRWKIYINEIIFIIWWFMIGSLWFLQRFSLLYLDIYQGIYVLIDMIDFLSLICHYKSVRIYMP